MVLLANTAHLGGMIRHDEIRPAGGASVGGVVEGKGEKEDHDN